MKKLIIILISITLIILGSLVKYGYDGIFKQLSNDNIAKLFIIEKGSSVKNIALNLENEDLIRDSSLFVLYSTITQNNGNIQAGEYLLSPQMSTMQILNILTKGEINKTTFTILEGWNIDDIANYFEEKKLATKEEVYALIGEPTIIENNEKLNKLIKNFNIDKPNNLSLEGYLFPDTYYIDSRDNLESIVLKILQNWETKITPNLKEEIIKQDKTIFEIITVASMIEKEAKTMEDKKLVSDIMWRRLEVGMPLQICATVLYALREKKSQVYTTDTEIDSPYNTYKYKGLPIGPISNPGMDSLLAAIYPTKNNNWYYLSSLEGKIYFSQTLTEHNYKKSIYIK